MTSKRPSIKTVGDLLGAAVLIVIVGSTAIFLISMFLSLIIPVLAVFTVLLLVWYLNGRTSENET